MGATGWSIRGSPRAGSFYDIHDYNRTGPDMPHKNATGNNIDIDIIATGGEMGSGLVACFILIGQVGPCPIVIMDSIEGVSPLTER